MASSRPLLLTRLAPPPQQARLLARRRVDEALAAALDYPWTLMIAPAGSGKTTALSSFAAHGGWPAAWLRLSANDDPALLLLHLAACWRTVVPLDEQPFVAALERGGSPMALLDVLISAVSARLDDETLLILEDYHLIDERPELRELIERLIDSLPLRLHLVLSTRAEPQLEGFQTAAVRGELLRLTQADLAFDAAEAQAFFALYERYVPEDCAALTALCRGWPLALQALAQSGGPLPQTADAPQFAPLLDPYFSSQVLNVQPQPLQELLLYAAALRSIDLAACAALPLLQHLRGELARLPRAGLFVETAPTGEWVFQPLFLAFLRRAAAQRLGDLRALHLEAAAYYRQRGDEVDDVYHLLAGGQVRQAAETLERQGVCWTAPGRAELLLELAERLRDQAGERPRLLEAIAVAQRQLGRFDEALALYERAEQAYQQHNDREGRVRALRGRAEVYLDTVQPAPAGALLKQALKLLPRERHAERADILLLQAENWANHGRADVALLIEAAAHRLRDGSAEQADPSGASMRDAAGRERMLPARLLLRSGRLQEARAQLEERLSPSLGAATAAHREPPLLLAFTYTLLGNSARALALARRGLLEAQQGGSKITEAVAHMRLGHAYQVVTPLDAATANRHYLEALALAQDGGVARTRAEGYLGLALLHGHGGDLAAAEAATAEGLALAEVAGDTWVAALLWLALGGAGVAAGVEGAPEWLEQARQRFVRGGDEFGQAMVDLWIAIWHVQHAEEPQARARIAALLGRARRLGYDGPLTGPSLFGPRDLPMLVPLLLRGRAHPEHGAYARQLLRQSFPTIAGDESIGEYHPGYTLRIQMLGTFRVWRGMREIQARDWQRDKARQLLQLLLTYRGHWLQREQICAWLWPDNDLEAAEKQFKVTLNALNTALEPLRPPRVEPFFIRRQGLAYSFAPSYGCWIDVDEFELRLNAASSLQGDAEAFRRNLHSAVQIYRGDYLAESLYDAWTIEERERLLARYLTTTTALADDLARNGRPHQAIQLCELVIQRDRCYEEAYQVLMRAHYLAGSRSQALRCYARCAQALQTELDIEPLPDTTRLYEQIKRNQLK